MDRFSGRSSLFQNGSESSGPGRKSLNLSIANRLGMTYDSRPLANIPALQPLCYVQNILLLLCRPPAPCIELFNILTNSCNYPDDFSFPGNFCILLVSVEGFVALGTSHVPERGFRPAFLANSPSKVGKRGPWFHDSPD